MHSSSDFVRIFEVGPRDGLQNEKQSIAVDDKVAMINALSDTGLTKIEAGSFVSPKWVPQMANTSEVFEKITRRSEVSYGALTPNLVGLNAAFDACANEVAVFGAASESFSQKNINCSISESIERFKPVIAAAQERNVAVRGYVSCVVACPYDGDTAPDRVAKVAQALYELGCYEISLGDTIGVGTPNQVRSLIEVVRQFVPVSKLAMHCHDTYGQAIANICTALEMGIRTIDSSVAGLGGCPYAKGASGNVASEDVVYLLNGLGMKTGVDLTKLIACGNQISKRLQRPSQSKTAIALTH